jgi:signal transduction histidine kinase
MYLKFDLYNKSDTSDIIYFFPGISFSEIRLFKLTANNNLTQIKDLSFKDGYQPLEITPKDKLSFLVLLRFTRTPFNRLTPQIIKRAYLGKYQTNLYYSNMPLLMVGYLFSGIILMMSVFSMANFILSGKKEFLYNYLYASCIFLLIFLSTYIEKRSGVLVSIFIGYFAFSLLAIGTIFYIAFTRKFLTTKVDFPKLNILFRYSEWILFLFWLSFTYLHFFTDNFKLQQTLENIMKLSALLLGVIYISIALVQKNRLLNYLALGNGILIFLSSISLYILLQGVRENSIFSRSILYYEIGIAGELTFFLIGLSYKNRKDLVEKTKEQEALKLESEKQNFTTKLAIINAQQEERTRISTDMHDDLGSGITAIRLYSELAKNKINAEAVPEIEKISSSANELLNNMNAIIWTMNSSNDSLENMIAYIRNYTQEYLENTGINCNFNNENDLPNLVVSGQIRRNVFLVIKETLNNILKHSKATKVTFTFSKVADGLLLNIQDNGIGIDLDHKRRFGNGLNNMKKRMEEMKIDFSIENKNGTLVTLHYKMTF